MFKAKEISTTEISKMEAKLFTQFSEICTEDGVDFVIRKSTTNGVSFYVSFFKQGTEESMLSFDRVEMRISDHVCGRRGMDYQTSYENVLAQIKKDAVDVMETPLYDNTITTKLRDTDKNVSIYGTTKRGKTEYRAERLNGRVRRTYTRKNGQVQIEIPAGLGNKIQMI